MDFYLKNKAEFSVCGYCKETSLETCTQDLGELWREFEKRKQKLFDLYGFRKDFYGLMWKTHGGHYCYLIGIEAGKTKNLPEGTVYQQIPAGDYAVVSVPASQSAVDAWTEFYYQVLPAAGYEPNDGHGFDFEYYPNGGDSGYELWTPVQKVK